MKLTLSLLLTFLTVAGCTTKGEVVPATDVELDAYKAIILKMHSAPSEAEIVDERNGVVVVRAYPRYALVQGQAAVRYPTGEFGPEPPERYLKLKVNGRTCSEYWESRGRLEYPDLWYETQYTFILTSTTEGSACNIMEVRNGDEVLYSRQ